MTASRRCRRPGSASSTRVSTLADVGSPLHLISRFFGSLRPGSPKPADEEWGTSQLLPGEVDVWRSMWNPDRRHAIGVARRVERALGTEASRPVLAAALLHDAGKTASGLHTYGR